MYDAGLTLSGDNGENTVNLRLSLKGEKEEYRTSIQHCISIFSPPREGYNRRTYHQDHNFQRKALQHFAWLPGEPISPPDARASTHVHVNDGIPFQLSGSIDNRVLEVAAASESLLDLLTPSALASVASVSKQHVSPLSVPHSLLVWCGRISNGS